MRPGGQDLIMCQLRFPPGLSASWVSMPHTQPPCISTATVQTAPDTTPSLLWQTIPLKPMSQARQLVMHAFDPSTWVAAAGGSLWIWGQASLQSDSQGYTMKPCLQKPKPKPKNKQKMVNQVYRATIVYKGTISFSRTIGSLYRQWLQWYPRQKRHDADTLSELQTLTVDWPKGNRSVEALVTEVTAGVTEAVRKLRFTDYLIKISIKEENSRCLGWKLGRIELFPKKDLGRVPAWVQRTLWDARDLFLLSIITIWD